MEKNNMECDTEENVKRITLGEYRNSERPLYAAELLDMARQWLEDNSKLVNNRQPYLVRSIDVDLYTGRISLYLARND